MKAMRSKGRSERMILLLAQRCTYKDNVKTKRQHMPIFTQKIPKHMKNGMINKKDTEATYEQGDQYQDMQEKLN